MTQTTPDTPVRYKTETFDAIVALAQSIRPKWETPGLRQAIRDSLARDDQPTLAELAYAVLRVAENFAVVSPAVIAMDGPHWRLSRRESEPPKFMRCPKGCGDFYLPKDAPEHECKARSKDDRVHEHTSAMHVIVAEVNATACSHGTPRAMCAEHRAELRKTGDETEEADG